MSFDLYLLPLKPADNFDAAMDLLDSLDGVTDAQFPQIDVHGAVARIVQLDGRYKAFEKDFSAIAAFEKITESEARQRYSSIELNGNAKDGSPLAQMIFCRTHIVIHWYSATTQEEMGVYLEAICKFTELSVVDPQSEQVWRIQPDGSLA